MENFLTSEDKPTKVYPVSVVYQQTKVFDAVLKKITKKPQILENFKRVFYTQPKLPSFIRPIKGQSDQPLSVKFPKLSQEDIDFFSLNAQEPLYSKPEKQSIFTPTWDIDNNSLQQNQLFIKKTSSFPNFDKLHQAVEILESRIIYELDKTHFHTGQILEIAEKNPPKEITESERERIAKYKIHAIPNKIPANWEPRAWDKPTNILSEAETKNLYERIEENKQMMADKQNWDFNGKRKKKGRSVAVRTQSAPTLIKTDKSPRRQKKAVVVISTISYETDSDSGDTDWDDFGDAE